MRRHILLLVLLAGLFIGTSVVAQETPTPEPPTVTPLPTETATLIPTETFTPEPSLTPAPIPTVTETPSLTPSQTETATEAATLTATASATIAASETASHTPTETATATSTASLTATVGQGTQAQNVVVPQNVQVCNPSAAMAIASVGPGGVQGDANTHNADTSSDGRYIAFESIATNLVTADTNNLRDIFVYDRQTCQTTRVSVAANGDQANGESILATISGDGRYVGFTSQATNLVSGDTNNEWDVFVKDRQSGAVTRIQTNPDTAGTSQIVSKPSISSNGQYIVYEVYAAASSSFTAIEVYDLQTNQPQIVAVDGAFPTISGDGNLIAFNSFGVNVVPGDTNNQADVFVYNRQSNQTERVSISSSGAQSDGVVFQSVPFISSSGRFVVFTSNSANLVSNDANGVTDAFIRDRQNNQTILISLSSSSQQGNGNSSGHDLSADGRYIAFTSTASNLVTADTNNLTDIYVHDMQTGQTFLISSGVNATGGNGVSAYPVLSGDGSSIAFQSTASDLIAGDTNGFTDVFVARLSDFVPVPTPTAGPSPTPAPLACTPSAAMQIASVSSGGVQQNGTSSAPPRLSSAISSNGQFIAFSSNATNLVGNDTNNAIDVFVFDRVNCQTTLVSVAANGTQANNNSVNPAISADGRYVAFLSSATNLVATGGNPNSFLDVYIKDRLNGTVTRILGNVLDSGLNDRGPSLSADGQRVVYISETNGIQLYNFQTSTFATVSGPNPSPSFGDRFPSISGNGRYVVFLSDWTNLVSGDSNGVPDVFVWDYDTSAYTRVSVSSSGEQANGASSIGEPSISGDGRYVSFASAASNLVTGDTNDRPDVFIRDLQINITERVSISSAGVEGSGALLEDDMSSSLSDNGRYVVFMSVASTLVNNDGDPTGMDIFARDRQNGQTFVLSRTTGGVASDSGGYPVISADGQYVTFQSDSPILVTGDGNGRSDVFVARLAEFAPVAGATATVTPTLTPSHTYTPTATNTPVPIACNPSAALSIASVSSSGVLGNIGGGGIGGAPITADGRYIVYASFSSNLVPNDTNAVKDIFLFDRQLCQTTRLSVAPDGTQADADSDGPSISRDGRYVVFLSKASNLVNGDTDTDWDLFVLDRQTNALTRIDNNIGVGLSVQYLPSLSADGSYIVFQNRVGIDNRIELYDQQTAQRTLIAPNGVQPSISANGQFIAFTSSFSNLVSGDTNGFSDVFVYDRLTSQYERVSVSTSGTEGNGESGNSASGYRIALSADGRYVAFESQASNLVSGDTSNRSDIFLRDRQTGQTTRVSISSTGEEANQYSESPSVTDDGRYIAFMSAGSNLIANDGNTRADLFVRDRISGQTFRIPNPVIPNNVSGIPHFMGDGTYLMFYSSATNLVAGDTNNAADIFVARLAAFVPGATATATAAAAQTATAQAVANTLIVNTIANSNGACDAIDCSLVEAINHSNNTTGVQRIVFNIPGSGVRTISLGSPLMITASVIIDATTQPGYSGTPLIELVGSAADAIVVNGASLSTYDPNTSVTIRGFAIHSFSGRGIVLWNGQGHVIEDNFIGIDATGLLAAGNDVGMYVRASNSIIRNNVISGNLSDGLRLISNAGINATNNTIVGNFIGTDVTGSNKLPNLVGILLTEGASNNTIGGVNAADANVISGNGAEGILLQSATTSGNAIVGNLIGPDASGLLLLGNGGVIVNRGAGVVVAGAVGTTIGGATSGHGNDISGNPIGVNVDNNANNTIIQNNLIAENNGASGILVNSSNTLIANNTIAFNNWGIRITNGTGNRISNNSIYANGALGIDLGTDNNVTPNDPGETDFGANGLQNFPVIAGAVGGDNTTVSGSLNSAPNATYQLEFFGSPTCDANGYGEGRTFLGTTSVTTNASGNASFNTLVNSYSPTQSFGVNWSGTFFATNNLTGTGTPVTGINGLNFNWGTGAPVVNGVAVLGIVDNFSARFTSVQNFAAGTYTFIAAADDGMRIYVDGLLKLDKFVPRPLTTDTFQVALTAGPHTLTVEYFEGIDQAILQVQWSLNGAPGGFLTSTATDANNNTSEFSACATIRAPLGLGSYEETNINVGYSGNWISFTGVGPRGGSMRYSNTPTARVQFSIDNSVGRITLYRTMGPQYGAMALFVNGTQVATIPGNNGTVLWAQPITISLPGSGNRTIELRNTSSSYISFDAFDLLGPPPPLPVGNYEETHPNLTYSGNWLNYVGAGPRGGSMRYSNDPAATVSIPIADAVGRVTIYRTQNTVYGSMALYQVENGNATFIGDVPGTGPLLWGQALMFSLPAGTNRKLELRNTSSSYIGFEAFDLLGAAQPLNVSSYEESNTNLTYVGNWLNYVGAGPKGGSMRYSNDPAALVRIPIVAAVGRVTIYRTQNTIYGTMGLYQVENGNATFIGDIPGTGALAWGQAITFTLPMGTNRTLELRNTGSSYIGFEAFDLLTLPQPLPVGYYEETNTNLTYTGNWLNYVGAAPKGGSMKYSNDPAATVSIPIADAVQRVIIYRTQSPVYGTMALYQVENSNATFIGDIPAIGPLAWGQAITFTLPAGTNRALELRHTPGTHYIGFEAFDLLGSLGIGSYEETNPNLIYTGNWLNYVGAGPKGGSMKYSNDPNAKVSIPVADMVQRVRVYRTQNTVYGTMELYQIVNGVGTVVGSIPGTGPLAWGQAITFTLPAGTNRSLELRHTPGTHYIGFEAFDLLGALPIGNYEETNLNLTYTGNWLNYAAVGPKGGSMKYSNEPTAHVSFTISDTVGQIVIYRTMSPVYGPMTVHLDGSLIATIPGTNAMVLWQQPYTVTITPNGSPRTIEIRNASSSYIGFEAFDLLGPPPLSAGNYEETNVNLTYAGNWLSYAATGPRGGSMKYSNDPTAHVSFIVADSVRQIVVYRTMYAIYGAMDVYLEGALIATIPGSNPTVLWEQPYTIMIVPNGRPRTVELRNASTRYVSFEAFDLLSSSPSSTATLTPLPTFTLTLIVTPTPIAPTSAFTLTAHSSATGMASQTPSRTPTPTSTPSNTPTTTFTPGPPTATSTLTLTFTPTQTLIPTATVVAGTLVVNTTSDTDDGICNASHCSLREAINEANSAPGVNTIQFNIGGSAPHSIIALTPLPVITDAVILDGTTNPDFVNQPVIALFGSAPSSGLEITGGNSVVRGLVISSFLHYGIILRNNGGNTIEGNFIGINVDGIGDSGNVKSGILIENSPNNRIGGLSPGARNVISGNNENGITIISAGSTSNVVQGNYIGTDVTGTLDVGNTWNGIAVDGASQNTIGGSTLGAGNIISGNDSSGIGLGGNTAQGAIGTVIQGNFIGTNAAGTQAIFNTTYGVFVHNGILNVIGGSDGVTPGGNCTGACNVIIGAYGLVIYNFASYTTVQGNYLGSDVTGTHLLNTGYGLAVYGNGNTIGGITPQARNVINANSEVVVIGGNNNIVQGNFLGTDPTGMVVVSGTPAEVRLGGSGNRLGGTEGVLVNNACTGACNLIPVGIRIYDYSQGNQTVQGNFIGPNVLGTAIMQSGVVGIKIDTASEVVIGGSSRAAGNTISGQIIGILMRGVTAVTISGNYVGTDSSGRYALPNNVGIETWVESVVNMVIGGVTPGAGNVISGNTGDGIGINDALYFARIQGNLIGVDATGTQPLGNGRHGIYLAYRTTLDNIIGGLTPEARNTIAFNGGDGIYIQEYSATTNLISGNSIFSNQGLGLDLGSNGVTANDAGDVDVGPNGLQNFPVLTDATSYGTVLRINGTLNSEASKTYQLDFFANDSCDTSGYGEGQVWLGTESVSTDSHGDGQFSINLAVSGAAGTFLTAIASNDANNSSEFSACVQVASSTTVTPPPTYTPLPTMTFTPTLTLLPSDTPTVTLTATSTALASETPIITYTPTATEAESTAEVTPDNTLTPSVTSTPGGTATNRPPPTLPGGGCTDNC